MNVRFVYVNGSCWQEPLFRHLVCYLFAELRAEANKFKDLCWFVLFHFFLSSKGALRGVTPSLSRPKLCACIGGVLVHTDAVTLSARLGEEVLMSCFGSKADLPSAGC